MSKILIAVAVAALTACNWAWSQSYPTRPVRIVVGFGAGGPDTTARIVAAQLTTQIGQPVIVDNRPGAGGTIGADIVAKAVPDGHTLLVASTSFALFPSTYKKLPFDVLRDFAPISHLGTSDAFILVASPSLQARNVQELIALARVPGNRISFGSNGNGTTGHLIGAVFNVAAKTSMVHVPYKSAAATLTGLLSGEIQVMFATAPLAVPLIKAGKIRAFAYDHTSRAPFLPDVPTLAEAGGPPTGVPAGGQYLFTTAKTPPAILARIEAEVRRAVASPEVRERFLAINLTPLGNSSADFRQSFASAVKRYGEAARAAGIEPE
jgi:tripartite-type tricarboxylate transporter receptor subunit TctC